MNYPNKLKILSDDNELKLVEVLHKSKPPIVNYIYTKSETKLNMILPLTDLDLQKLIDKVIAIELK